MLQNYVDLLNNLEASINKVIKGKSETIKFIITALIADGHVLLEDYPGSGKTTLAKTLGNLIEVNSDLSSFKRIQFTPDLLPSDILGVNIFEPKNASFRFVRGPIFSHVVLADEINRAGAKAQAAFLECMAEKQVTVENVTYPLDNFFFVIGTQNPLDIAGTYPLPIVQLDRFLLKLPMTYVDQNTEIQILNQTEEIKSNLVNIKPVITRDQILEIRNFSNKIVVNDKLIKAITDLTSSTRNNPNFQYGLSTRAAIMLLNAIKAYALVNGRDFVTEDDLKQVAPNVLQHRIKLFGNGSQTELFWQWFNPIIEKLVNGTF